MKKLFQYHNEFNLRRSFQPQGLLAIVAQATTGRATFGGEFFIMIVAVDFLDHWKTKKLRQLTGHRHASEYLLRLWAHCQTRNTDILPGDAQTIAAICQWPDKQPAQKLLDSLLESRWLEKTKGGRDGKRFVAHGWAIANNGLLSARKNGKLGGRPKGKKTEPKNPSVIPSDNRTGTDGLSIEGNGIEGNGIEGKRRGGEGEQIPPAVFVSRFAQFWKSEFPKFHDNVKYIGDEHLDNLKLQDFSLSSELASMTPDEVEEIFETARDSWQNPTGYYSAKACLVRGYLSNYNAIRDELKHGNDSQRRIKGKRSAEELELEQREKESLERQRLAGKK